MEARACGGTVLRWPACDPEWREENAGVVQAGHLNGAPGDREELAARSLRYQHATHG